jgi:general secretion pathway protein L
MRAVRESNVTTSDAKGMIPVAAAPADTARATPIIVDGDGPATMPATMVVPSEDVRLLAVDLPLANHAKRLEALPFAIEDRIAGPLDSVHVALGAELGPKRYLAAVVAHATMRRWVAEAEAAGQGDAAILPDCLTLPRPDAGEWAVDADERRAVVRSGDGTGFAIAAPLLRTAWEAAGRPAIRSYGAVLPDEMAAMPAEWGDAPLARRITQPAIDLRQGAYARRRARAVAGAGRRLAWIVGLGALAHTGIALADTVMLRVIADRRADETRTLVATTAPGTPTNAGDLAGSIADMLPEPGRASAFLPLVTRVSGALAPVAGGIAVRAMRFEGDALVIDIDALQPGMASRLTSAMADARIEARVVEAADGSIRLTAAAR